MAASKNNSSAESNGGFKTAAFGFDKNDVNMYIAGLRKKMKSMEEEFEQKLASALENPAASNDALKHEREVIRAETEKIWGEKLNERNNILKQQQARISELEQELKINKDKVESLRTQLAAATSDSNSDGVISARAAKAYMQFTRELRYISDSVEKTLSEMEQRWRGEFNEAIQQIEAEESKKAAPEKVFVAEPKKREEKPLVTDISDMADESGIAVDISADSSAEENNVNVSEARREQSEVDESLLAEPVPEAPKPAPQKSAVGNDTVRKPKSTRKKAEPAAIAADKELPAENIKPAEPAAKKLTPVPEPIAEKIAPAPEPIAKKIAPAPELAADDDIASLFADSDSDEVSYAAPAPAEKPSPKPKRAAEAAFKPKIEVDDDLSSLLADDFSDFLVEPADNTVGADDDFEKLLTEPKKEIEEAPDIVISEAEPKVVKGDDLNAALLSDIVINPEENIGDLGEMIREKEYAEISGLDDLLVTASDESDRNDGLGIAVGDIDFGMDSVDDMNENVQAAKSAKKEEDLFDFSFLADASDDDEDDMSTDVSFSGML